MGRIGTVNGQQRLFTHRGTVYTRDAADRELRADILAALSEVFGGRNLPQLCPECGSQLKLLTHPTVPYAWCGCGFALSLRKGGLK